MAVYAIEDIAQMVFDAAKKSNRILAIDGGPRHHAELPAVSTIYSTATNRILLPAAKRFIRMFATRELYWVDSAVDDADAATKLAAAGSRGFLPKDGVVEFSLSEGIKRLDFLAAQSAGAVYVTGLD